MLPYACTIWTPYRKKTWNASFEQCNKHCTRTLCWKILTLGFGIWFSKMPLKHPIRWIRHGIWQRFRLLSSPTWCSWAILAFSTCYTGIAVSSTHNVVSFSPCLEIKHSTAGQCTFGSKVEGFSSRVIPILLRLVTMTCEHTKESGTGSCVIATSREAAKLLVADGSQKSVNYPGKRKRRIYSFILMKLITITPNSVIVGHGLRHHSRAWWSGAP